MILSSHVKQYHSSDQNMAPISPRGRAQVLTKQGITGSQAPASLTSPLARLLSHPPTPPAGLRAVPGPHQVHSPLTLCLPAASFPAPLSPQNICRIYLLTFFGPLLNSVRTSLTTPIKDTQSEGLPRAHTFLHISIFCWNYSVLKCTSALKLLNDIINIFMRNTYLQLLKVIFLNVLGQIINLENKNSDWYYSNLLQMNIK